MPSDLQGESLARSSREDNCIINVEFYYSDQQFSKPAANDGGRKLDFNFYASKLFHSGGGKASGAPQEKSINSCLPSPSLRRWLYIIWMFVVCISSGALVACVVSLCVKGDFLQNTQDILFFLVGMVLLILCLWSGVQFMKACHALGRDTACESETKDSVLEHERNAG